MLGEPGSQYGRLTGWLPPIPRPRPDGGAELADPIETPQAEAPEPEALEIYGAPGTEFGTFLDEKDPLYGAQSPADAVQRQAAAEAIRPIPAAKRQIVSPASWERFHVTARRLIPGENTRFALGEIFAFEGGDVPDHFDVDGQQGTTVAEVTDLSMDQNRAAGRLRSLPLEAHSVDLDNEERIRFFYDFFSDNSLLGEPLLP
ncbi:MAG: hypothetical protein AAFY88_29105 [Acidobacteriota bacterium]